MSTSITARSSSRQSNGSNKLRRLGVDISNELPPGAKRERKSTSTSNNSFAASNQFTADLPFSDDESSLQQQTKKQKSEWRVDLFCC